MSETTAPEAPTTSDSQAAGMSDGQTTGPDGEPSKGPPQYPPAPTATDEENAEARQEREEQLAQAAQQEIEASGEGPDDEAALQHVKRTLPGHNLRTLGYEVDESLLSDVLMGRIDPADEESQAKLNESQQHGLVRRGVNGSWEVTDFGSGLLGGSSASATSTTGGTGGTGTSGPTTPTEHPTDDGAPPEAAAGDGAPPEDATNPPEPTQGTSSDGEVPEGTVSEVLAWVGDDSDRAEAALAAEESGQNRSTLIEKLEVIAATG